LLVRLEEQLNRLDAVRSNPVLWVQRQQEFHDVVCQAAQRPRLAESVQKLHQTVAPYIRLYLSAYQEAEMPGSDHRMILEAMKRGDPNHADRVMRDHILSAAKGVIDFLRRTNAVERGDPTEAGGVHSDR
jgi:DNA-binding GntR family transcriptional regulator